jgi:membrane protein YqaA with SNARE-associated domain
MGWRAYRALGNVFEHIERIGRTLYGMGGVGLLILSVLDSSFLFAPMGEDVLVVALAAGHSERLPYYALMATAGSVIGAAIMDVIGRRGGEKGLERMLPPKRLDYLKSKIHKGAGWSVALACILPPPFPFTAVLVTASAFQYPRKRLFPIIAAVRFVRYNLVGLLAVFYGQQIIDAAEHPVLRGAIVVFILLSLAGSVLSVRRWVKHSRHHEEGEQSRKPARVR